MNNSPNRILDSFDKVLEIIKELKGFTKAAIVTLALATLVIFFLFFTANISSSLSPFVLGGYFVYLILVIVLVFTDTKKRPPARRFHITVSVHETGQKALGIADAEVRLAIPNPLIRKTDRDGVVSFDIDGSYANRTFPISASKAGYIPAKATQAIKLTPGRIEQYYLPLQKINHADGNPPNNKYTILRILASESGGIEIRELKGRATENGIIDSEFDKILEEMRDIDRFVAEVPGRRTLLYINDKGRQYLSRREA